MGTSFTNFWLASADEAKKLVAAFKDPSGIRASGIVLGGVKYLALRADERSIYGKKVLETRISSIIVN